jgi:hypothetical protein
MSQEPPQHILGLTQPQSRLDIHPATTPPQPKHRPQAAAGPATTPLIDRMVQEQQAKSGNRPPLDNADPTRSARTGLHGIMQHLAQNPAHEVIVRLRHARTHATRTPSPRGMTGASAAMTMSPRPYFMSLRLGGTHRRGLERAKQRDLWKEDSVLHLLSGWCGSRRWVPG